jgi:4-amino-4-deoxy-L-arabinose transferase-like glycosyltransferase
MRPEADRPSLAFALTVLAAGVVLFAVRCAIAARLGLAPDEAYYWQWSRDLALVYPDHPPLTAWLVRLGTILVGDTCLGVRLFAIVASLGGVALAYALARELDLDRRPAALAAFLSTLLPAPAVGAIIATPDAPLGVAYLAATLALVRLGRGGGAGDWIALGLSMGVGLLAKHAALLIVPLALLTALAVPCLRRQLATRRPWFALASALAVAAPNLIAEARAGFPSISFQLAHLAGLSGPPLAPGLLGALAREGELIAGQFGLLTPVVAVLAVLFVIRRGAPAAWIAARLALVLPVMATAVAALFCHPEQNWASLGHPIAAVGAFAAMRGRAWFAAGAAIAVAATVTIHAHALHPFLPLPADRDPVSRLHGWQGLDAFARAAAGVDAVVCDNYGLAAELDFAARPKPLAAPIRSADRPLAIPPGTWLLLDERGDWSGRGLRVDCLHTYAPRSLIMRRADGRAVRTVDAFLGEECRVKRRADAGEP